MTSQRNVRSVVGPLVIAAACALLPGAAFAQSPIVTGPGVSAPSEAVGEEAVAGVSAAREAAPSGEAAAGVGAAREAARPGEAVAGVSAAREAARPGEAVAGVSAAREAAVVLPRSGGLPVGPAAVAFGGLTFTIAGLALRRRLPRS